MLTVGSLFAGIGGFDLGFERAGMRTLWFCEQDAFCQRVLAKHWPGVPCYPDVRALVADTECGRWNGLHEWEQTGHLAADAQLGGADGTSGPTAADPLRERQEGEVSVPVPYVDVLCGGFPCQGISLAGKGLGLADPRSGLWSEYARLVNELRPRYVVVENVPALKTRGLEVVLADLMACGYDAEWDCIPASAVGAPHRRDRIWLVAYPNADGGRQQVCPQLDGETTQGPTNGDSCWRHADGLGDEVADTEGGGSRAGGPQRPSEARATGGFSGSGGYWLVEPDVGRVADGVPRRVDRLRSLGNALVPQIAQLIGERIVSYECPTA